uniref:Homing endonuclease LAGLIDADG domain-containing protein n=1 Tax=Dactylella tenuis TaxID=383872 RepID=A0A4Y5MUX8_9PEZI|nr:hypothetical protein [Dactylella tenuis]QCW06823.1 hypothetical protein [Dactylella tenuis]
MKKTKIGYCVSKIINNFIVKEQRVDGSLSLKPQLRDLKYTLKNFERNSQIIILSNQINLREIRLFTSKAQLVNPCFENYNFNTPLNPWALSGFIDGEGSFIISIYENNEKKSRLPREGSGDWLK